MNKILCCLLVFLMLISPVLADIIGQTDESTRVGGGARPIGLGGAYIAVADDSDTIFINPAGLASLRGPQAMAMFTSLMENEVYYTEFCGAIPASFGSVGIGYIATGVSNIPTYISSTEILSTDYYDGLLLFSYGTPLARFFEYGRNFYAGTNLKVFNRGWSGGVNEYASGWSADFGIKYIASPYLNFGLVRQNFIPVSLGAKLTWTTGIEEALGGATKLGMAVKFKMLNEDLIFASDLHLPSFSGLPETMHFGLEWKVNEYLAVRSGYSQNIDAASPDRTTWRPSIGVSFGYSGMRVDYAYVADYNDPALTTHYISLSYMGEPWLALKGETAPLIESPKR